MIKKRIKKNLGIVIHVLTNGEAISLEGRDISVERVNPYGQRAFVEGIEMQDNRIAFTFRASEQNKLGVWKFIVWENYGKDGQTVVDRERALQLVASTDLETPAGHEPGLDVDRVDLNVVDIEVGIKGDTGDDGKSLYELMVSEGRFSGTLQEFLDAQEQAMKQAGVEATEEVVQQTRQNVEKLVEDTEKTTSYLVEQTRNATTKAIADAEKASEDAMAAKGEMEASELQRKQAEHERGQKELERQQHEEARETKEAERQQVFEQNEQSRQQVFEQNEQQRSQTFQQGEQSRQQTADDAETQREQGFQTAQQERDAEFQSKEAERDAAMQTISQEAQKLTELKDTDDRMKLLLGYNAARSIVNLELGISGKYVKCETRSAVANAAFAISKPIAVDACSELLIKTGFNPSDVAHSGLDLTVIAIYEEIERQRTVQKKDASGNPLYYVVTVDEETGSETVTTDETTKNTGYPVYTQETYTEQRYLPNNEDRFVAIPDSGYYVANIPQSCKVVISYKPGVTDTAVIVEKHGALANLISQVFGIYEHRTMVEAMVSLAARVDALESRQGLLGNAKAVNLDVSELTKCLYPTILRGHGVPSATNIPDNLPAGLPWDGVPVFIGQLYINLDATSSGLYYAKGHDSVADWKQA